MLLYHAMMLAPMFILAEMSVGWIVAIAAVLLGGIYVWVLHRRVRKFRRALEGGSTAELPVDAGSLGELATAINRRLRDHAEQTARAQSQLDEVTRTLRATPIAVIALDAKQRVLGLNPAAARLLACDEMQARGRLLQELALEPALNAFIDEAFAAGGVAATQLEMKHSRGDHGEDRAHALSASSEPLEMKYGPHGIVLSLVDVTRARQLEAMRSEFAANVSHELRTPITTIRGFVDTLTQLGRSDLDRSERFLAIVQRSVVRLSAIVEDILTLSLLEDPTRHAALETQRVPLLEIMQECAEDLAHTAELREISVAMEDPHGAHAMVNRSLAIQAVTNLLSNAIRHAPVGSIVILRGVVASDSSGIEVIDRGPGIPSKHLERIFERFYRVDKSRHRETGGTGLGLAIVKHIAQVHGGRVEAQSQVGEGCHFRVWFPS